VNVRSISQHRSPHQTAHTNSLIASSIEPSCDYCPASKQAHASYTSPTLIIYLSQGPGKSDRHHLLVVVRLRDHMY